MVNTTLLVFLIIEILLFSYIDIFFYNKIFTPFNILAYPIAVILTLATYMNTYFDFKPLSIEVYALFILGFSIFWLGGQFSSFILGRLKKTFSDLEPQKSYINTDLKKTIIVISWGIIISLFFSFYFAFMSVGGFKNMGTDQFAYLYAGSGITGHLLVIAIPCIIYLVTIFRKKDYLIIITFSILFICIILYQVKTYIFLTFISCILTFIHKNDKARLKARHYFLLSLIIFLLFEVSYIFSVRINTSNILDTNVFLAKHFVGYLFAGVNGLNEHFANCLPIGIFPDLLFMPFINLINFARGIEPMSVVSNYYVPIDLKGELTSNVKTIFGTILIYGGYFTGILYVLFLGFISYFVMLILQISNNIWYKLIYIFLMSGLFLGWYDLYFNNLTIIEVPFIMFLFSIISRIKFLPATSMNKSK